MELTNIQDMSVITDNAISETLESMNTQAAAPERTFSDSLPFGNDTIDDDEALDNMMNKMGLALQRGGGH